MAQERLQKVLAQAGIGSRRACEEVISSGRVAVNGNVVTELGMSVDPLTDEITVDGAAIHDQRLRYVIFNKPAGYLSGIDQRATYPSWHELVKVPERLFAVGRLDHDSEGLLLLTNDGDLANKLIHPAYEHPKTYFVQVEGVPNSRKIRRLEHGVMLDDGPTAPAKVILLRGSPTQVVPHGTPVEPGGRSKKGPRTSWLRIILREGRKRQLRRMTGLLGHPALRVVRVGLGPLELGNLAPGRWRDLTEGEVRALQSLAAADQTKQIRRTARIASVLEERRKGVHGSKTPKGQSSSLPGTIAIDGPAASGKSTIGSLLARELGYLYLDTGVMYRAVASAALSQKVDPQDERRVTAIAQGISIEIEKDKIADGRDFTVLVDGRDVTWEIREPKVERAVSPVSAFLGVRQAMTIQQRRLGQGGKIVMVGRDIGTVVVPGADLKIYLDASLLERAKRRFNERRERGETVELEAVVEDMRRRDKLDSSREHSPLQAAPDAIVIDSTNLSIVEVFEVVLTLVRKWSGKTHGR